MAQYNLLGGVSPLNPEYEQQVAMRGKGTNWAEYGLRKEALKEQKKQNRFNNIISGINTALSVVDTGLKVKDQALREESQHLINTERELDIQTKRIDLNTKQTQAAEDKEYLDGLMTLLENNQDKEAGAWILSHTVAAQRNADATYAGIQRIGMTQGSTASKQLLSQTLPKVAEQIRQFDVREAGANSRAAMSLRGQQIAAASRIQAANINALGKVQAAETKAAGDMALAGMNMALGGSPTTGRRGNSSSSLMTPLNPTEDAGGYVNFDQKQINDQYNESVATLNTDVDNSIPLTAAFQDVLGMKQGIGNYTFSSDAITSAVKSGVRFRVVNVKDTLDSLSSMFGGRTALQEFVKNNGGRFPMEASQWKTASGEPIKNTLTGSNIYSLIGNMPSEVNTVLSDALQNPEADANSGNSILLIQNADGTTERAVPINKQEAIHFQNFMNAQIRRDYQKQEDLNKLKMFHDSLPQNALGNRTREMLQPTLNMMERQVNPPDINPEAYRSQERLARNDQILDNISSRYAEDSEKAIDDAALQLGVTKPQDLTRELINKYCDLKTPLTAKQFSNLKDSQKKAYYEKFRSGLATDLQERNLQQAANDYTSNTQNIKAQQTATELRTNRFLSDFKNVLSTALVDMRNHADTPDSPFSVVTRALTRRDAQSKIWNAMEYSLDRMDITDLRKVTEKVNTLLESMGEPPIQGTGEGLYLPTEGADILRQKYRIKTAMSQLIRELSDQGINDFGEQSKERQQNYTKFIREKQDRIKKFIAVLDAITKGK